MVEHTILITDSRNQSMRVLVRLGQSRATWLALDHGFLCYEKGVADRGCPRGSFLAWLALYCYCIDKDNLILHLDDFQGFTRVQDAGQGWIYQADYLLLEPGKITWKLVK